MKTFQLTVLVLAAAGTAAYAQQWEVGGIGGAGFLNHVSVSNSLASATAGFATGAAGGVYVGQALNAHWAGELHYDFFQSNQKLTASGQSAEFNGMAHTVHYDVVFHTNRKNAPVQYFALLGGGVKVYQGTGTEAAYQPLYQVGWFTKTNAVKPVGVRPLPLPCRRTRTARVVTCSPKSTWRTVPVASMRYSAGQ